MAVLASFNLATNVPLPSCGIVGPSFAQHIRGWSGFHNDRVCRVISPDRSKREATRKGQSHEGQAQ